MYKNFFFYPVDDILNRSAMMFVNWHKINPNLKRKEDKKREPYFIKKPALFFEEWSLIHIEKKPRKLSTSSNFSVPKESLEGYEILKKAITKGDNLQPFLTKNISSVCIQDKFLYDFGLYHFHLGRFFEKDYKGNVFIERSKNVALAVVRDDEIFMVSIEDHNKNSNPKIWSDTKYIETIHSDRPDLISNFKILGLSGSVKTSDEDRLILRKKNANSSILLKDGTVYSSLMSPLMSSGNSLKAVMAIDYKIRFLNDVVDDIHSNEMFLKVFFLINESFKLYVTFINIGRDSFEVSFVALNSFGKVILFFGVISDGVNRYNFISGIRNFFLREDYLNFSIEKNGFKKNKLMVF